MGRVIGLIVLALLGFYVAWPAYSLVRIKSAVEADDAALLGAKVDFPSLRISLKPVVTAEAEKAATAAIAKSGGDNAALLSQLKTQMMPQVVELALNTIVTPESLLRIHREGGDVRKTIGDIVQEKIGAGGLGALAGVLGGGKPGGLNDVLGGKLGGLFGKKDAGGAAPAPVEPAAVPVSVHKAGKATYGLSNVKTFSMNGLAGYSIGVAKDGAASLPDVVTDLAFTGGDWKIVGVRPRL